MGLNQCGASCPCEPPTGSAESSSTSWPRPHCVTRESHNRQNFKCSLYTSSAQVFYYAKQPPTPPSQLADSGHYMQIRFVFLLYYDQVDVDASAC